MLGRKRHILTDTLGLLLAVSVHPASVQDRDGAEALLREARRSFPFLERIIGDAGYQGRKMETAVARTGTWGRQIVRRCDRHRFIVLPKRWIVERTLAWISRCRRLARDYERHARKAAAFVRLAMVRLMLRRVVASNDQQAQSPSRSRPPRLSIAPEDNGLEVNVPRDNSVIDLRHPSLSLSSFLPFMGAPHARPGLHVRPTPS